MHPGSRRRRLIGTIPRTPDRRRKVKPAMSNHLFVVLSNPIEGREDEYAQWYQNVHLHDVVALDGFEQGPIPLS